MSNKIIITEEQYSRLFLNEQRIVDKKDNTNVGKESQNPYGITSKSYTGPTKYVQAQNQWKLLGAENPKTGRSIVDNDTVNNLKNLRDGAINDWNQNNKKPEELSWNVRRDQDSNSPEKIIPNYMSPTQRFDMDKGDEMSKINKEFPYNDVLKYNENIKQQNTLIPEWCKKPNLFKWSTEKMNEEDPQDQKRLKSLKIKYPIHNIGWRQPKGREYGYYISYRVDTGRDPFVHCNKDSLKGVWVYKTKIGYHCGCMVDDNGQQYMDNSGTYTTDYALGFHQKIKKHEKDNQPGFLDSVAQWAGGCFEDYHCVLDILSIAALAVPGVGLALSAGFDFVNGISYGVESYNAENSEDKYAAILAGGLTMFGGIMGGGVKQTNKILKYGAKNPKIFEYASDVMSTVQKEYKGVKKLKSIDPDKGLNILGKKVDPKLSEIYGQAADKYGLTQKEVLMAHDLLKNFSKIDPAIAKQYSNALSALESKIQKGNLVLLGKHKGLKTAIDASGGDVVVGLKKYMGKVARKEAVMEASLFILVTEAMEQPAVQKWISGKYNYLKYRGRTDIRGIVEKNGYEWDSTKKQFYSTSTGTDNDLLKLAWLKGWRPHEDATKTIEWLIKNPKYQTKRFKSDFLDYIKPDKPNYKLKPKEGEGDKSDQGGDKNVRYLGSQEELNILNSADNNITDDEYDIQNFNFND